MAARPAFLALLLAAGLYACSKAPAPDAAAPALDDVIAAERAFAADEAGLGFKKAFLKHSADDAILLGPLPVNAHQSLAARPDDDLSEPRPHLIWWPLYAGVAASADLGFTTGPYAVDEARRGYYFTVWRKQADGAWKWVFDGGVGADASSAASQGSPVARLAASGEGERSADLAMTAVNAAEEGFAAAAANNILSAYELFLDKDSRLHGVSVPPSTSAEDRSAVLMTRPSAAIFRRLGGGASAAGDLAWTYGDARWRDGGADRSGHYARIWQKRKNGWRLIFDQLVPPPPPPPNP